MTDRRVVGALAATGLLALVVPMPVMAHDLGGRYDSPLPLVVYLVGAALAVAISFAVAFASTGRWRAQADEPLRSVPRPVIWALRAIGLVGWLWIMAQLIVGGQSDAKVATLFTWVYGWVGLAIVCALVGPVWSWLDPFTTLHDLVAWPLRRMGLAHRPPLVYPDRAASWPAVAGFVFFVWLELVDVSADIGVVVLAYTIVTLAGMAIFGRDRWRTRAEVFSVWFGLLGRLARYAPVGLPGTRTVRRRHFPDGLLGSTWDASLLALVAVAAGAILYDGLSQTEAFYRLVGSPDMVASSILLGAFLTLVAALALVIGRRLGVRAVGAGLLPIALGYLIAHYLTYLLGDGQRIIIAISDPFQLGWDLFGTAFASPSIASLPPSLLWTVMFTAVVGGHVVGAWAGHLGVAGQARAGTDPRRAQLPLAIAMVLLTTLTLWSLGQAVFSQTPATAFIPSLPGTGTDPESGAILSNAPRA